MIDIFINSIVLSLVLVAIHTWFGAGILERGIIFTDLSIAHAAALGSAVSLGYFDGDYLMILTFVFALGAGLIIAYAQTKILPLEAFIGLLYVLSASGIMMVLSHSAEGMEHFKSLLANDILFTTSVQLYQALALYLLITLIIVFIYKKLHGLLKEVVFFTLLSLTVTSSVQLVGVLVVFTLLIAPILVASMQRQYSTYPFALLFGWVNSLLSIGIAFYADLPTGYTMVSVTAIIALISVLILSTKKSLEVL